MELMHANRQWASRPADERFTSLPQMKAAAELGRRQSRPVVAKADELFFKADDDKLGLQLFGANGHGYRPSNWAFGQLAQIADAPSGYLRTLPADIASDALNFGLRHRRKSDEVGILLQKNGTATVRAATGPDYGRIWDDEVIGELIKLFGDGVTGAVKVPGEWGKDVPVTQDNTTLYRGDRDMFVFLCDEKNRIEMPNRRDGKTGTMARGFFLWNSEVGARKIGIASFLFDHVCGNRIVWNAMEFDEVTVRHTKGAPERWREELLPALEIWAQQDNSNSVSISQAIEAARSVKLEAEKLDKILTAEFGARTVEKIKLAHLSDEDRPMETIWDIVVGATAFARSIGFQEERVKMERIAGSLIEKVALAA